MSNVITNDLIAFLALYKDLQRLMFCGALFQALVESLMNVAVALLEVPSSIRFPLVIDLVFLANMYVFIF